MMKEKLQADNALLEKQIFWLSFSFDECSAIGLKDNYTPDEFGKFETLCSRYARGIDFLIRKIFRSIDAYEFENQGTLVDVINNAHKRGLIKDIEEIRLMKDIRNTIAHEYIEDALADTFEEVLTYSKILLELSKNTKVYIEKII